MSTNHCLRLLFIACSLSILSQTLGCGSSSSPDSSPLAVNTPEPSPPVMTPDNPNSNLPDYIPGGGTPILTQMPATDYDFSAGDNNGAVGRVENVTVEHEAFSNAVRIYVDKPDGVIWNGRLVYPSQVAVEAGDLVLAQIYFRKIESTDESGAAFVSSYLEGPAPDYRKYFQRQLVSHGEWQEYLLPAVVSNSLNSGELGLHFGFGGGTKSQTFEIGLVRVLNYTNALSLADLPETLPTYIGREADANWRETADARIEQHRKGDFELLLTGPDSQPLANTQVSIELIQHHYHFGSAVVSNLIQGSSVDSDNYRTTVLENFNQVGPENDLKWGQWIGEWGDQFTQQMTLQALDWLTEQDLYVRGHVLVWPSKRNLPNYLQPWLPENAPAQADPRVKQEVLDHIDDIVGKSLTTIDEWDVLNEPFDNHYLMDAFGRSVMLDWFQRARSHSTRQGLYINDYSIMAGGGLNATHQQHFEDTIRYLVEQNAPITGIGMQGHFSSSPTPIERVYAIIDRFHQAFPNLDIRTTELDISTTDEVMQADYTRDFMTIFFSHPATVGIQKWGFWEGAHWRPEAAMYRMNWQPKPNALVWKEMIYEHWHTHIEALTIANGSIADRGFYGHYKVTLIQQGEIKQGYFDLLPDGPNKFELQLE